MTRNDLAHLSDEALVALTARSDEAKVLTRARAVVRLA